MRIWTLVVLIICGLCSCKSVQSEQYLTIQEGSNDSNVYYFKILKQEDIKQIQQSSEFRYRTDLPIDQECIFCMIECNKDGFLKIEEINNTNVNQVCRQNPRMYTCDSVGFNETSKVYNKYKDIFTSKDVVIENQVDAVDLHKYFEYIINNFYIDTVSGSSDVCMTDIGSKVIFSNGWKEVEADLIYKWEQSNDYYHATNEIKYDTKEEAVTYCKGLTDLGYKWKLISSTEFDTVNIDRKMAIFIPSRMHLLKRQCFYTLDGEKKSFSDKSSVIEQCRKENSKALALCVSNG